MSRGARRTFAAENLDDKTYKIMRRAHDGPDYKRYARLKFLDGDYFEKKKARKTSDRQWRCDLLCW